MNYRCIVLIGLTLILRCASEPMFTPWPNGEIPYVLIGADSEQTKDIMSCMAEWELMTGGVVYFRPTENVGDGVLHVICKKETITNQSFSCGVGFHQDGFNVVILATKDRRFMLHEFGHVIGLEHEHQRIDRDRYIDLEITTDDFQEKLQLMPTTSTLYEMTAYPYDYTSIMHYGVDEFINKAIVDSHGHIIGGDVVTIIDALKVQEIYNRNETDR